MQYMGSKNRISKYLLPVILKERTDNMTWVEPFVGGANMIDKVDGLRIGNDIHKYLIALLISLQDGWIPPTNISKEEYYNIKNNPENYDDCLVGFVGFLCSFGGKWFGGYAFNNKGDNYADRGSRCLVKQAKNLKGIKFICGDYLDLEIPENSLIYCDIPYKNTTDYSNKFNYDMFWEYCRNKVKEGHIVFISEYTAPADFISVLDVQHKTILDKNSQYSRIERLFKHSSQVI